MGQKGRDVDGREVLVATALGLPILIARDMNERKKRIQISAESKRERVRVVKKDFPVRQTLKDPLGIIEVQENGVESIHRVRDRSRRGRRR